MITGRCLCGGVRYETGETPRFMFTCYCATCRRESGAGHVTAVAVQRAGLSVAGETRVIRLPRTNGEQPIPRTICAQCGTTLFATPPGLEGVATLRAGTIETRIDIPLHSAHNTDQAQPWDPPPPGAPGG